MNVRFVVKLVNRGNFCIRTACGLTLSSEGMLYIFIYQNKDQKKATLQSFRCCNCGTTASRIKRTQCGAVSGREKTVYCLWDSSQSKTTSCVCSNESFVVPIVDVLFPVSISKSCCKRCGVPTATGQMCDNC